VDPEPLAASLAAQVREKFAAAGVDGAPPRLYMENGRFMTGPYGWLVARCTAVKEAFGMRYFGLDACMANLMRPGMYGSYHAITVPAREGAPLVNANVVGQLCENNDWFAKVRAHLEGTLAAGNFAALTPLHITPTPRNTGPPAAGDSGSWRPLCHPRHGRALALDGFSIQRQAARA
jgi:diaminopimelate decarboxylase